MTEAAALTSLLAAEHAAVYAYGLLGARLDDQQRPLALAAFDAHRVERNALVGVLRTRGLEAPGPAPAYDVRVADALAAWRLAIKVETELAVRWRDLIAVTDDPALRRLAVGGLQASAVRNARWRQIAHVVPLVETFPGQV